MQQNKNHFPTLHLPKLHFPTLSFVFAIFSLCLWPSSAFAATLGYISTQTWGGTSSDYTRNIAVDSSGNIYVTGNFSGTADFDPGAGAAIIRTGETPAGTIQAAMTPMIPTTQTAMIPIAETFQILPTRMIPTLPIAPK